MSKLTVSIVKSIIPGTDKKIVWDDSVKGLCVVQHKKSVSYSFKYRNQYGVQRFTTIGKTSKITLDEARQIARDYSLRISQGEDPVADKQATKKALTVSELCDWYMKEGVSHKKQSTLKIDQGRIDRHIKPLIGKMIVKSIVKGDIERMMHDIQEGKKIYKKEKSGNARGMIHVTGGDTAASRTVQLLGAIFEFAKDRSIIENNPAHGIKKPKSIEKDIYLTLEEIKDLGVLLDDQKWGVNHSIAVHIIRLILLTGCRKDEIESLRWEYVDFKNQCFRFPDTKTGKQNRACGAAAIRFLKSLYKNQKEGWVFPARNGEGHFIGTPKVFRQIAASKNKEGVKILKDGITLHGLRHTYSTIVAEQGYNEFTIAGLLGHRLGTVTSRYTHMVDKSLIAAANVVSLKIEKALSGVIEDDKSIVDLTDLRSA